MNPKKSDLGCIVAIMVLLIVAKTTSLRAQSNDSSRFFGGSVAVTNNGISLLPSFSLNKPAALVIMNLGKRLSFDPEFRFALEGKPWSFIFWARYKLVQGKKFRFTVGAHPGYLFKTETMLVNGAAKDIITTERYLAGEVSPSYFITENISVGIYYLRGHGFEESSVKSTNFLTLNVNFNRIDLFKSFYAKFHPQIYYLTMDNDDGYFVTWTLTLATTKFPLSIQSTMNQSIKTNIVSKDFLWNVSLVYSFGKLYKAV